MYFPRTFQTWPFSLYTHLQYEALAGKEKRASISNALDQPLMAVAITHEPPVAAAYPPTTAIRVNPVKFTEHKKIAYKKQQNTTKNDFLSNLNSF